MQLIQQPGEIIDGSILFDGREITRLTEKEMDKIRGRDMATIFQEPVAALNPVMRVEDQIAENVFRNNRTLSRSQVMGKVEEMLELVGLDAKRTRRFYPHELSGGMAQRVMIAMALSSSPKLLIADEPTSALDVTIQAQILELLHDLVDKLGYSAIMITHDMGVAADFCDRVAVMYAGNTVEYTTVYSIFDNPLHPYSRGLFRAVPRVGKTEELADIPGEVPDLVAPPSGCRFHPRCRHVRPECKENLPALTEVEPGPFCGLPPFRPMTVHRQGYRKSTPGGSFPGRARNHNPINSDYL